MLYWYIYIYDNYNCKICPTLFTVYVILYMYTWFNKLICILMSKYNSVNVGR